MVHGFLGERNRHQVVEMAVVGTVAQVFAVQRDLVVIQEAAGTREEGIVQRFDATQRQRQAVAGQWRACGQLFQRLAEPAAHADPVVRRAFEEIEISGRRGQQLVQQCATQAQAGGNGGRQAIQGNSKGVEAQAAARPLPSPGKGGGSGTRPDGVRRRRRTCLRRTCLRARPCRRPWRRPSCRRRTCLRHTCLRGGPWLRPRR